MKTSGTTFSFFLLLCLVGNVLLAQGLSNLPSRNSKAPKFNAEKPLNQPTDSINLTEPQETILKGRFPDKTPVPNLQFGKDSLEEPVDYYAMDSIIYDIPNKQMLLYGNASILYKDITVRGGIVIYNWETQEVESQWGIDSMGNKKEKPEFAQA